MLTIKNIIIYNNIYGISINIEFFEVNTYHIDLNIEPFKRRHPNSKVTKQLTHSLYDYRHSPKSYVLSDSLLLAGIG